MINIVFDAGVGCAGGGGVDTGMLLSYNNHVHVVTHYSNVLQACAVLQACYNPPVLPRALELMISPACITAKLSASLLFDPKT